MGKIYKNKAFLNQRAGSLVFDNTTDQEQVRLSHRSGSNVAMTNTVTSELATNNKQLNVQNDYFETVKNDKSEFTGGQKTTRIGETNIELKGFKNDAELTAFSSWKDIYKPIAGLNSQFKLKRGGVGYPNGDETKLEGDRAKNPVIDEEIYTVENIFSGYVNRPPKRKAGVDEVVTYKTVPDRGKTIAADKRKIDKDDIERSAGQYGSKAPGVLEFGAEKSAATEWGDWKENEDAHKLKDKILEIQDKLNVEEQKMGDGGDEIIALKRNRTGQIGAEFNDYPSVRIDEKGRSQALECIVSDKGAYKNHDYIPHVEEVDNSSNFPCGNDDVVVGNRFSRTVGSGGINLKTTGAMELGGATLKGGFKKVNINASHGVSIGSETSLELQSLKTITLRTNRQVYVESSLGVWHNFIVGGGTYTEGETYLQHVTAPLEVQETEDTAVWGKFATDQDRRLLIGEAQIGEVWYPVYAKASHDLIATYPHSHHFNNLPLRLTRSNFDVRRFAENENINDHENISQSLPQVHERKYAHVAN